MKFVSRIPTRSAMTTVAVLIVAWALYIAWPRRMRWVRSELTGKEYHVKNIEGAEDVADRLAMMELKLHDFVAKAAEYAPGDPRIANIRRRWNGTLAETPTDDDVAYSMAKDAISVCVRSQHGGMESENTSMFVLVHELSHIATDQYGHPSEFWANMRFLLEVAEATGCYSYQDFDAKSTSYCGRQLAASPLTCVKNGGCASELPRTATASSRQPK